MPEVRLARVYDPLLPDEGVRVLVDRLWPRGVRKDDPRVGLWMPRVAPSPALRREYGHDPAGFDVFRQRYEEELATTAAAAFAELVVLAAGGPITIVTASRDVSHCHAAVLVALLAPTKGHGVSSTARSEIE